MQKLRKLRLEQLLASIDALVDTMKFSVRGDDVWRFGAYREYMRIFNDLAASARQVVASDIQTYSFDLGEVSMQGDTNAFQQKTHFDSVLAQAQILRALVQQNLGLIEEAAFDLANFIKANLRRGIHSQPDKERQVQDALETLLVGKGFQKGLDYDRETGRVKVSIKESTPDFIFPKLALALEVKLATARTRLGRIVDEINADIRSYGSGYRFLTFVVYDIGQIQDEEEFKRGLEDSISTKLVVVKH